jgi:hypothetical protein
MSYPAGIKFVKKLDVFRRLSNVQATSSWISKQMSHGYLILMSYVATFGLSLDVQGTYHWTSSSSVNPSPGYPRDISVLLGRWHLVFVGSSR